MEKASETLRQEALMALAILAAMEQRKPSSELPKIEDVSMLLYTLRAAGVDIGDLSLRKVPGGYYSEDLETLIGHYLASGYADQRSPVRLTPKGTALLREIVNEERQSNGRAVEHAAEVLGITV